MTAARLIHALVLADVARAIRPEVRPKKDALTRELEDLVSRRRQIVEMRGQETLRLGRASKVQEKSLKSHTAWLDKRIEEIETDLRQRLVKAPPCVRKMISCGLFRRWEARPPRRSSPNCAS